MKSEIESIYHDRTKVYDIYLGELRQSVIKPQNKMLIEKFLMYLSSKNNSKSRRAKLLYQAMRITLMLEACPVQLLSDIDRDSLIRIASQIHDWRDIPLVCRNTPKNLQGRRKPTLDASPATKSDYLRCIRQFYNWYKSEDARLYSNDIQQRMTATKFYSTLEKDIKATYERGEINEKEVITDKDIDLVLLKGCSNVKERAFISLLHETGARASEYLNLRIGDLDNSQGHYWLVTLPDGKTGKRRVPFSKSIEYVKAHLTNHPDKQNINAFLWVSDSTNSKGRRLKHQGAQKVINRAFNRANIAKKHNLHWFRHSRATILHADPNYSDSMISLYMGWTQNSNMHKTYSHVSSKDLENAFRNAKGLSKSDTKEEPKKCDCCSHVNLSTSRYCAQCNKPLSLTVVISDQQTIKTETDDTLKKMMEMFSNPQMLAQYQAFISQKIGGKQ